MAARAGSDPLSNRLLPNWIWLWFPPLLAVLVIAVKLVSPDAYARFIDGERGLIELATPLVAITGVIIGIRTLRLCGRITSRAIRIWILLTTLGCVYLAGEELSWGQQLFRWDTPEGIARINDQNETNLHNVSSWFDQKPRLLLELWVLIGGIVLPLQRLAGKAESQAENTFTYWFWPTLECLPTALLAIAITLPERYKKIAGIESLPFEIRWSEPQEYYFALFLLIYLLAIQRRLQGAR